MKNKGFLLFLIVFLPLIAAAQNPVLPDDETSRHLKNEAVGGVVFHQNGWGGFFRRGVHKTGYIKKMYEVEAVSMSNPKELYIINPAHPAGNSFVFGKINSLLILRTGYGIQKVLFSKAERAGVEVKYNYFGGISWGIAKPVFMEIFHPISANEGFTHIEQYDPQKYSLDSIYGKASFVNGLSQLQVYPGLYGKFGLNFEFGAYEDVVKALEVGIVVDAYMKPIPIMANIPNNNIYLSFYLSFMYGGRW